MNLQTIVLAIVVALVTYISFHQTRSLFTRLRNNNKVPSELLNVAGPLVIYVIAFVGVLIFAFQVSALLALSDLALTVLPSILVTALIVASTWIFLNVAKHFFDLLIVRKRFPTDIVHTIALVTKYCIIILGFSLTVLNVLNMIPAYSAIISASILSWFSEHMGRIAVIIAALIFTQIASKLISTFFGDLKSKTSVQSRVMELASTGVRYVLYVITALIIFTSVLSMMGVPELTDVITNVFSVLVGVGISFAAAGAIGNIISGLILMNWKPYKTGDRVELGGTTYGDIVELDVMFTKIVTPTQETIHLPNSLVLGNKVTKYEPKCQVHPRVSVGYNVGRQVVEEILIKAALMTKGIVSESNPTVYIVKLEKNYVEYELRACINDPNHLTEINSDVQKNILDLFSEANISLMIPEYSLDATLYGVEGNNKK